MLSGRFIGPSDCNGIPARRDIIHWADIESLKDRVSRGLIVTPRTKLKTITGFPSGLRLDMFQIFHCFYSMKVDQNTGQISYISPIVIMQELHRAK